MREFVIDMLLYSTFESMIIYGFFLAISGIAIKWKRDLSTILILALISAIGHRVIDPLLWQFMCMLVITFVISYIHKKSVLSTLWTITRGMLFIFAVETIIFFIVYGTVLNINFVSLDIFTKFILSLPVRVVEVLIIYYFIGGNKMKRKFIWFGKKPQKKTERTTK